MEFESEIGGKIFKVTINDDNSSALVNGTKYTFETDRENPDKLLLRIGTKIYKADNISVQGREVNFAINGTFIKTLVKDEDELLLEKLGFASNTESSSGSLNAPMPGKILHILVNEGDEVSTGQPVLILEAMKMENELKAPSDGIVQNLFVDKNENVEKNQTLLEISPRG